MAQISDVHHYLPVFYTKRWAGADGRVCTFTRQYGDAVRPKRLHPKGTGYVRGLYEMRGLSEDLRDQFEKLFLGPADSQAADALTFLESGSPAKWHPRNRTAWSRFLLTLMLRMPEDIVNLKGQTERLLRGADPDLDARYEALRLKDDPPTFAEWLDENDPHVFANAAFRILKELMDNAKVGKDFNNLYWCVIPTPNARFDLMASDSPILRTTYFGRQDAYLMLPIGPRRLFMASRDPRVAEGLMRKRDDDLVTMANRVVVGSARNLIICTDDIQLEFVKKRMGREPIDRLMDRYTQK